MKTRLLIILTGFITVNLYTQNEAEKISYKAYLNNSAAIWENCIRQLENEPEKDYYKLVLLGESYNGYLITLMVTDKKQAFESAQNKVDEILTVLLKKFPDSSRVHALQAGIYSVIMGYFPKKGMILGSKNEKSIKTAIEKNPEEPRAWMQKAGSKYHTPEAFGGSITESIDYYKKTIELFEKTKQTQFNWYYLNSLAWLGQAYSKNNQYEEAKNTYIKAVEIEPEFWWVKYQLLPEVSKKLATN